MVILFHLKIWGELLMNYYERIQRSIDFIESNLENTIDINLAAQAAYMSLSNFYRMFFALAGYSVKEYIRLRRISLAVADIVKNICIIDIAVKYGFESGDSFSRAFKRITGYLPSEFRRQNKQFSFERMSIMDKYFKIQDKELLERYPDIKVLKELEPTKVAYYNFFGADPENNAFRVMMEWVDKSGLKIDEGKHRIFGYNSPSPQSDNQTEYGYEVCITIDDNCEVNHPQVKTKLLQGGQYAVTSVKREDGQELGEGIMLAWKRFGNWLSDSKYIYGGHQELEEHPGFDEKLNHTGGIDLYMPISEKDGVDTTKTFEKVEPMWTATYTAKGTDAANKAREYLLNWAHTEGLFKDNKKHRIFAYYNHDRIGQKDFFFKVHITVDEAYSIEDSNIQLEDFKGGYYAVMKAKYKYNGWAWGEFMTWLSKSKEYTFGDYWFFEEYVIDQPFINMETDMILHMPVKQK